jgi:hypothetical protein
VVLGRDLWRFEGDRRAAPREGRSAGGDARRLSGTRLDWDRIGLLDRFLRGRFGWNRLLEGLDRVGAAGRADLHPEVVYGRHARRVGYRRVSETSSSEALYTEPILAWRLWRVRRLETLRDEQPLRLAAAGRLGIPKFWEPRIANRAVCSNPRTAHEAPWPECRCGIYGLRERADAERALARYSRGRLEGWVLGRASLWGRIVEGTRGWRAQLAYPYDLVVFGGDELAAELRDVYAVDVTATERPVAPERRAKTRARRGEPARAELPPGGPDPRASGGTVRFQVRINLRTFELDARILSDEHEHG